VSDSTESDSYAERLQDVQLVWWKRVLPVQWPYEHNLRRQHLGVTLDIGCGIGRSLASLPPGSLGVDHNARAVEVARERGHDAMTVTEFLASPRAVPGSFDSLLLAHVLEHMDEDAGRALLTEYLRFLRPGGSVFMICPQEVGYRSDPTHVRFVTDVELVALCRDVGLTPVRSFSFPFPRWMGKVFIYNEFCLKAVAPDAT
jgi:SAM-dependent methyltransferase